jgi:hypothetical protein
VQAVYESPFFHLQLDEQRSAAWLSRTGESTRDQELAQREIRALLDSLAGVATSKMRLVVDLRAAVGRNDEPFESVTLPRFRAITDRFSSVGMLVATAVGKMQVARVARELGVRWEVFDAEALARAFAGLGPLKG